ncbi:cytochrome P450 [Streptomyces chrestomyceticus]|uniref:cytochrome P450 n=1 Tax=Streptomyces chrestomyceticus TaxID=68185 RepID=UPI0033E81BB0
MSDPTLGPALVELPATHHGAVRLGDPRYQSDSAAVFRTLRQAHGPVAPVLLHGGVPAWLVLGYRELLWVTDHPDTFARDSARWRLGNQLPPDWPLWPLLGGGQAGHSLMYAEKEAHRRRAGALNAALDGIDRKEFAARCEEFGEQLVRRFSAVGRAELMADYAMRLPVMAMSWALGVPAEYGPVLVEDFVTMIAGGPDAIAAHQRSREMVARLVDESRGRPGRHVTARLAADAAGLSREQLVEDLLVTLTAGHQTTAYLIGNALRLMLTDARHTDAFLRSHLPVQEAINAVLWDDTPTQTYAGRFTARPVSLGSYTVPEGDLVLLGIAAANRDPFIRPDVAADLDGSRAYLSYSHGEHSCPHAARDLSQVMATTGIDVLLDALPGVRLACRPEELRWDPSIWMRGLKNLPVCFFPAP